MTQVDWMEIIEPKITPAKMKRPSKHKNTSRYRDNKTGVHSTVNGVGHVGRVYRKTPA